MAKKQIALTKAEKFYIENNLTKSDEELATDLEKPLPIIREYLHRTKSEGRISKLFIREKGCTIMTAGASMAADEQRQGYPTQRAIQDAVARGDYEEATRLQNIMKKQSGEIDNVAKQRQSTYIHRINR